MGTPNSVNPLLNGGSPYYLVNRSLRFRASATAYLTRTFGTPTSAILWTWSGWVKRGALSGSTRYTIMGNNNTGTNSFNFEFTNDSITVGTWTTSWAFQLVTTQVFRDPSAWYHITLAYDSAQSTSTNRVKLYVNGSQITSFSTASYPSASYDPLLNVSGKSTAIGSAGTTTQPFDGYLAEVNFIDGQALTPSSFGVFDTNGIWQPIRYSGTYGTNGFYLPFSNTTSTTTLVADSSGNGNNWTPNNISLTAGTTYDSMIDSPTVSASASNYCVLNPLDIYGTYPSNGNLSFVSTNGKSRSSFVIPTTGKWYWEVTATSSRFYSGLISSTAVFSSSTAIASNSGSGYYTLERQSTINNFFNASTTATSVGSATISTNDVMCFAYDASTRKLWIGYGNGSGSPIWYSSGDPSGGTNELATLVSGNYSAFCYDNSSLYSSAWNFGQRPFAYTPPTGFNALNTANLPQPTIQYGAPYMNAITYTGYGPLVPSGLGITPKRNASTQNVSKSLRFRASASAYLNRTPSVASGFNQWTLSVWFKRCVVGSTQYIIGGNTASSGNRNELKVEISSDQLWVYAFNNGGGYYFQRTSSMLLRDPSAWYHLVVQFDPDNATSANKIIAYINGAQVSWGVSSDSGVSGSITSSAYRSINNTYRNDINAGYQTGGAPVYFTDNYLAEMIMVSGSLVSASSFGETNSDGIWVPKSYTGTYGTNGFYLPFTNTTSTTTLVADSSGNGNNWTPNNISLTAGTTYDSMVDSPTDYASAGDYATMNPLDSLSGTASNGNLLWTATASQSDIRGTIAIPSSGKFYMECTVGSTTSATSAVSFGLATSAVALNSSNAVSGLYQLYASSSGYLSLNGTNVSSSLGTWTAGDILQIAVDVDNTKMWLGKNNTWYDSSGGTTGSPSSGANATSTTSMVGLYPFSNCYQNNATWNFGQRAFSYTAPTEFTTLNTYNLTAPSKTWFSSGNNSGRGSATAYPDFVWIKARSSAQNHSLNDTVRGPTLNLLSNSTNAEAGASTMFAVNKYGLTLGNDASVNSSSYTDVMWGWQAGQGTTSTNTSGTITSTTSVNATAGFGIVTYTGNGTAGSTVGHGLGVAPELVIWKKRSATANWFVWSKAMDTATGSTGWLYLNLTSAKQTSATTNEYPTYKVDPTSTLLTLNGTGSSNGTNDSTATYVAYCFAAVSGYSSFGSFTGNGSTDGPFIFTGFKPRWIMIKCSSSVGLDWNIVDTSRNFYNVTTSRLWADLSNAEDSTDNVCDILSNGFKLRSTNTNTNTNGATFIYAAFAENPFTISRAR